jgi:hypothetical protein
VLGCPGVPFAWHRTREWQRARYAVLDSADIPSNAAGYLSSPAARAQLELVEWAPDTSPALVQDVRIDHRRTNVAMPEQFLDRSDVVPGLEQMGREAVPERMARGRT